MVRRAPRRPTGTTTRRLTPAKQIALNNRPGVEHAHAEELSEVVEAQVIDLDTLDTCEISRITETHTREQIAREYEETADGRDALKTETVDRQVKQRVTEYAPPTVTPPPGAYYCPPAGVKPRDHRGDPVAVGGYPVLGDGVTPVALPAPELPSAEQRRANKVRRRRWESLQDERPWATAIVLENPPVLVVLGLVWAIVMVCVAASVDSISLKFAFAVLAVAGGAGLCGAAAKTH